MLWNIPNIIARYLNQENDIFDNIVIFRVYAGPLWGLSDAEWKMFPMADLPQLIMIFCI